MFTLTKAATSAAGLTKVKGKGLASTSEQAPAPSQVCTPTAVTSSKPVVKGLRKPSRPRKALNEITKGISVKVVTKNGKNEMSSTKTNVVGANPIFHPGVTTLPPKAPDASIDISNTIVDAIASFGVGDLSYGITMSKCESECYVC